MTVTNMINSTKLIVSITTIVVIGVILMTATGLIVYYGFCPVSRPVSNTISNCNCHLPACPPTAYCPIQPAELCPSHPLMPAVASTCIPPCCINKITYTINPPELEKWTENQLTNQTVLEWVMTYPPNSMGRLNVLTQLMELSIEPYIQAMSRRNCQSPYRMCTMCQSDRYEFLRCAMRITANKNSHKPTNKLKKINADFLKNYATDAYWHGQKYDNLLTRDDYQPLTDAYKAFWFVGYVDGVETQCYWCRDAIEPSVHMDCIRKGWGTI